MMKLLLGLSRAIDALNEHIGQLVYWLILAMVLISAGNAIVALRAQHRARTPGSSCSGTCSPRVFLLCAGYTLLHNEHIRIDIVSSQLSRPHADLDRHLRHASSSCCRCRSTSCGLSWPVFMNAWNSGEVSGKRRRPDALAGAAAGAGGLLPADRCRASPS